MRNLSALFIVACFACTPSRSAGPVATSASSTVTPDPSAQPNPPPIPVKSGRFDSADVVVIAKLNTPRITSVLEVSPPIYVHEFGLDAPRTLLGTSVAPGSRVTFESKDASQPFQAGKPMLVALRRVQATLPKNEELLQAVEVLEATPELEAAAKTKALPTGLGISVRQVAPQSHIQYQNDYGDGLFEVVIENTGNAPAIVPGLFRSNGKVDWTSALVVVDDTNRKLRSPGATSPRGTPVELPPGEKLVTRIDVKPFGLVSPAGGYRAYYSFRVDQLRVTSFFYYYDFLHGPKMGKVAPRP